MKRLLWAAWWAGVAFTVGVLGTVAYSIHVGQPVPPSNFNHPGCDYIRGRTPAVIGVFGDTQKGLAGFAALAERAKAEKINLAIHTGDLVSRADAGHFDLALTWVNRARIDAPWFFVPGNHDIKGGGGLFEKRLGERAKSFRWGPVDLVMIDNAVQTPQEHLVEGSIKGKTDPILLFMHVPPNDTSSKTFVAKPEYVRFLEMIRKYPVRYVFSGHAHGYTRLEDGGIVFIANGVGGDSDSWQFDQKAYLTIVEADEKSIADRVIVVEPVIGIRANFEHLAIGHVGELVLRRIWGIPALLLLIVVLVLTFRRLRRKKEKEPEKEKLTFRFTPAKTSEPPDIVI